MKKLDFKRSERILIIAPHPDDESIGCGGLLLAYPRQCDVVVLTDGRHGGRAGQDEVEVALSRKQEMANAMQFAGVDRYWFLDIEDGALSKNFQLFATQLSLYIDLSNYDAIFCPSPSDNHTDHACVYDYLMRLNTGVRIFTYEVWSTLANPSHYIDISDIVEKKRKLIRFHESQVSQVDYVSKILGLNCYRGMQVYPAIPYAEVYKEESSQ